MKQAGELWERIRSAFAGYPEWIGEGLVGVFAGLVLGFLSRILGRMVLIILVTAVVVGVGLHYFNVVSFNTEPVLKFFGMAQWPSASEFITGMFTWCKVHIVACIAVILGFILGWKFGG